MCLATFFLPKLTQKTAKTTPNGVKNVKLHSIYLDFNIEDTEDTERALRLKFTENKLKITIFSIKNMLCRFYRLYVFSLCDLDASVGDGQKIFNRNPLVGKRIGCAGILY